MVPRLIRRLMSITVLILLSACLSQRTNAGDSSTLLHSDKLPGSEIYLEDLGPAPEIKGSTWLNTNTELRLVDLKGKVVLIDFWTFG
jgi:hypothetical protein